MPIIHSPPCVRRDARTIRRTVLTPGDEVSEASVRSGAVNQVQYKAAETLEASGLRQGTVFLHPQRHEANFSKTLTSTTVSLEKSTRTTPSPPSEAKLTSPKPSQNTHFSVVRGNSSWSDQTKNYSSNDRQDMSLALRAWHFEWHFPSPPTVESMICHPKLFTRGQL